jgi:hypothetical protein
VPELEQMLGGDAGAALLVAVDDDVLRRAARVGHDSRDPARQRQPAAVEQPRLDDDDDTVDLLLRQPVERAADVALADRAHRHQHHGVARTLGRDDDAVDRLRAAVHRQRRGDDTDPAEPTGGQRASGRVGPVAERLHRGEDPVARDVLDVGAPVGDAGDGDGRHAGLPGDIGHRRAVSAAHVVPLVGTVVSLLSCG